ncbi:tetratricopeptide repeat protein [Nocardia sp. CNY236]|uniref:tetratricopeptide repeat protein n=1 Tax=Nocardia sp. CNY236 TaxID=1169152 RepID=UPI0003FBF543|nr:tetratricopeptide repeat protein [Nocardia sp. CNY236]
MSGSDPVELPGRAAVAKVVGPIVAAIIVLGFYFVRLGHKAFVWIGSGEPAAIALGVGVLILPVLGVWIVVATLRAALAHQHLARRIHDEGLELDVSRLPRLPSGRIERAAADELFASVEAEWEADPDNWRISYRLARAYDYAGDRARARQTMRRAVALEQHERREV